MGATEQPPSFDKRGKWRVSKMWRNANLSFLSINIVTHKERVPREKRAGNFISLHGSC